MAIVYVDPDDLKKSLDLEGTTYADEDVELACGAASEAIDDELGRSFGLGEDATEERLYPSTPGGVVYIDDLMELMSVEVDRTGGGTFETWVQGTDYQLEPVNAAGAEKPWTSIRVLRSQSFPRNQYAVIRVTGKFGWTTPPQRVVVAAGIIAARLVKRKRDAPFGFVINSENAAYIISQDPDLRLLFHNLSRKALFV